MPGALTQSLVGAPNPDTYKIELAARLILKNFPKFGRKEFWSLDH